MFSMLITSKHQNPCGESWQSGEKEKVVARSSRESDRCLILPQTVQANSEAEQSSVFPLFSLITKKLENRKKTFTIV